MMVSHATRRSGPGSGLSDLSRHNRALVLRAARDRGPLQRVEFAAATGLSKAATNKIVDGLIADGRLVERDDLANGRLRGLRVSLNPRNATTVGLELTNDGPVRAVVLDAAGGIAATRDGRFDADSEPEAVAHVLAETAREAVRQAPEAPPPRALGVAVPGTADPRTDMAQWLPIAHNWFDVPLQTLVQRDLGWPTLIDTPCPVAGRQSRPAAATRALAAEPDPGVPGDTKPITSARSPATRGVTRTSGCAE
ncbi:MAG: ROK family transcriptional regulator [Chloroflexi bacterium]|nr:ROK family transcriptional regulator [Chloroflexota bacterium]